MTPSTSQIVTDELWMRQAILQAEMADQIDEIPIGCIVLHTPTNKIIGQAHNLRHTEHDPTAHAEVLAIRQASHFFNDWRLIDCTLYVTLEPCPMCAGAIVNARIPRLVYGAADPKAGAVQTLYKICSDPRLNHQTQVTPGILTNDCSALLRNFFRRQRDLGKK